MNFGEMVSTNPSGRATVLQQAKMECDLFAPVMDILEKLPILTQAGRVANLHAWYLHMLIALLSCTVHVNGRRYPFPRDGKDK